MKNKFNIQKDISLCLVPDELKHECDHKIINAHSISKKGSGLNTIAEKSHVVGLNSPNNLKSKNEISFKNIGISKASTRKMFCSKHDREIFSDIENGNVFDINLKNCFLLAYRATTMEYFNQENLRYGNMIYSFYRDEIKNLDLAFFPEENDYFLQTNNDVYKIVFNENKITFESKNSKYNSIEEIPITSNSQTKISILVKSKLALLDVKHNKEKLDKILISKEYDKLIHYIFEGKETSKILCSFSINPFTVIGANEIIQDEQSEYPLAQISVNCVNIEEKGYVIFSWLKEHDDIFRKHLSHIIKLDLNYIEHKLFEYIIRQTDNIFYDPNFLNNLEKDTQRKIKKLSAADEQFKKVKSNFKNIKFMQLHKHYILEN